MAPTKRKAKSTKAAPKSRKAKVEEEKKEAEVEKEETAKSEGEKETEAVAKTAEDVKEPAEAETEKKNTGEDEDKVEDKAVVKEEVKKKTKGRKKKGEGAAPLVPGTKRVTRANPGPKSEEEEAPKKPVIKTQIIIEHCKSDQVFKTRAQRVQSFLLDAEPGLKISINAEKPRKGCFEIRDDAGKIYLSLQDVVKPFTQLKEIDMETLSEDILKHLQSTN